MNYDINIIGNEEDNGSIEIDRLSTLAKSTKEIAIKSFMFRYKGFSDINPDKNLKKSLEIRLENIQGNELEGTKLTFECERFSETIQSFQLNVFNDTEFLMQLTPMALVIDSFRQVLENDVNNIDLDKPLLKSLLNFRKNFLNDKEVFLLSNRGTIPQIEIKKNDFLRIGQIEENMPNPQRIIVSGKLDEMKVSKRRLGLETNDGLVYIYTNENNILTEISNYLGQDITVTGIAHFKTNGEVNFVDIQDFDRFKPEDRFFNKKPIAYNELQQIIHQVKEGKKRNSLEQILGKWPGDETDEEFDNLLKDI